MNCSKIERLLPLHVEGDLLAEHERLVAEHLSTCARCHALAGEFKMSQSWLHLHQPPDFDAHFYNHIRQSVIHEINSNSNSQPAFVSFIFSMFTRRTAFAASLALFACACLLGFLVYRNGTRPIQLASSNQQEIKTTGSPKNNRTETVSAPMVQSSKQLTKLRKANGTKQSSKALDSRREPLVEKILPPEIAQNSPLPPMPENTLAISAAPSIEQAQNLELASTDNSQEMLRIELQTSDPNIRIIWLAPKAKDVDSK